MRTTDKHERVGSGNCGLGMDDRWRLGGMGWMYEPESQSRWQEERGSFEW